MKTNRLLIQNLTLASMLTALAVLMASPVFAYVIMLFGVPAVRIDLIAIPVLLAGMILGPLYGLGVGAAADIFGFLLFTHVFGAYHVGFTINLALTGLISGLFIRFFKDIKKNNRFFWINVSMLSALLLFGGIYLGLSSTISISGTSYDLTIWFKSVVIGLMLIFYLVLLFTMIHQRRRHASYLADIDRIIFIVIFIEIFVVTLLTPLWVFQLYQAPPYLAGFFLRIVRAMWLIPIKVYLVFLIHKVFKAVKRESEIKQTINSAPSKHNG